jgi:hypothetical protein
VKQGVVLLPMTAGEVVLAYNLDGVDELKLPRDVYPEIFPARSPSGTTRRSPPPTPVSTCRMRTSPSSCARIPPAPPMSSPAT